MAVFTITTAFNIDLTFTTASLGKRFLALVIDVFILCAYYYLMSKIFKPLLEKVDNDDFSTASFYLVYLIPSILYQFILEVKNNGQTVGKMLTGLKVIDKEGGSPVGSQYLLRWALNSVGLFIFILPLLVFSGSFYYIYYIAAFLMAYSMPDILCVLINKRNQRIGDLAAGTIVIDAKAQTGIDETIYLETQTVYEPVFPQVMRLTDRDINGLSHLLAVRKKKAEPDEFTLTTIEKLKEVLQINTEIEGYEFLEQLLIDYNYLSAME
ncbi:MAG: RDD family protein [Chitinophagia bacterium]|nr:RDD family protein [Chitinophagia bacterium]